MKTNTVEQSTLEVEKDKPFSFYAADTIKSFCEYAIENDSDFIMTANTTEEGRIVFTLSHLHEEI